MFIMIKNSKKGVIMNVLNKIVAKGNDIYGKAPVTIAFLGDSVTQGCFEVYHKNDGSIETIFDSQNAFSTKLKNILNYLCPSAQINIINSGLSGGNAINGNERFERDIARFNPDLVVVGFALNDCSGGEEGKASYETALESIFKKTKDIGAECIMLTPNLMNDRVSPHISSQELRDLAERFAKNEFLDDYVKIAVSVAERNSVKVCDVYSKWKALKEHGVDVTELLSNKLNHPTREMNWMTAFMLAQTILEK